jgi:hypothetical protein
MTVRRTTRRSASAKIMPQEQLDGKAVDWLEKVSDELYQT